MYIIQRSSVFRFIPTKGVLFTSVTKLNKFSLLFSFNLQHSVITLPMIHAGILELFGLILGMTTTTIWLLLAPVVATQVNLSIGELGGEWYV